MVEERLLERIRRWEREPAARGPVGPHRVAESVVAHLRDILNTRQGSVPIAEDYGVPEFLDVDSIRDMEQAIRVAIQKFEPRLTAVKVEFVPQELTPDTIRKDSGEYVIQSLDALSLRFGISARLVTDFKVQIQLETCISSNGKIEVK